MPAEQPLLGERSSKIPRCVQDDLSRPFGLPVEGEGSLKAKPPRHGGPHGIPVEPFAFDLAVPERLFCDRQRLSLSGLRDSEREDGFPEAPLLPPNGGKLLSDGLSVELECRPLPLFPEVHIGTPLLSISAAAFLA